MAKLGLLAAAMTSLVLAGCVSQQDEVQGTEQMLAAAGFVAKPADNPQRQQQLATLKPYLIQRQMVPVKGGETFAYLYADPQYCRCIFTGDARNYQVFWQMAQQQRIAAEQQRAAELAQENAFDWGAWGPYDGWMFGPPVVVMHGHGHDHDHDHDHDRR